ncbi:right-handed parallel beta-helix repeat-containing protein [Streptomyces pseudovenezuelae]|uniref:right-handed parallel beta-helix repeat-containing protein n=1 Tax=Streptomyces pseudovenezuelae TaxID=67350 RepID=UPI002E3429A9|nr:right-handed parallel beta-helix repeat-containing protein [Streptomyces pseudovenezuelae]
MVDATFPVNRQSRHGDSAGIALCREGVKVSGVPVFGLSPYAPRLVDPGRNLFRRLPVGIFSRSSPLSRRSMLGLMALPLLAAKPPHPAKSVVDTDVVLVTDYATPQLAANAAAGKRLRFPSDRTYTVSDLLIPAGCYVEGNGAILRTANSSTTDSSDDGILRVGGNGVTIDGLKFDGNNQNQGGTWNQHRHQVRVHGNYSNVLVTGCDFYNIIGDGVYINVGSGGNSGHTIEVRDCTFTAANDNRNGVSVTSGTNVHVHHNTFTNMARPDMPGAIDIERNAVTDVIDDILVEYNTITRAALSGTGSRYGILACMFNCVGKNIVFRNNNVSGAGLSAACLIIGDNSGTLNASTVTVTGNEFHDAGGAGVELNYGIRPDITDNRFSNLSPGILNYNSFLGNTSGNTFTNVAPQIS